MCVPVGGGGRTGSCLVIGQMPRLVGHVDKLKLEPAHGVGRRPTESWGGRMRGAPFGVAAYAVPCEFRFWEGCGVGAGGRGASDYGRRRGERLRASSGARMALCCPAFSARGRMGSSHHLVPVGTRIAAEPLSGAERLHPLPSPPGGGSRLIEARSSSALTGADGGITIL